MQLGQVGLVTIETVRFLFGPALGGPLLRRLQGDRRLGCIVRLQSLLALV